MTGQTDGIGSHLARVAQFDRRPFVAFNTAFFADGAYIHVPAHTIVDKPIHVVFVSTGETNGRPAMSHPRVLAVLGDDSQSTVVESYAGSDGAEYFTNVVTEIVLGQNAVLDHYKLQHVENDWGAERVNNRCRVGDGCASNQHPRHDTDCDQ